MSSDPFGAMADGVTGRFWPLANGKPEPPEIPGSVRRDRDNYWVVDLEGWRTVGDGTGPDRGYPDAIVGV